MGAKPTKRTAGCSVRHAALTSSWARGSAHLIPIPALRSGGSLARFATAPAAAYSTEEDMEYEDYTSTSKVYDTTRVPIGMESLQEALRRAGEGVGKHASELQLLDTGCGTGNYINAVKSEVAECTGLEFNGGMLAQAKEKLGDDPKVSLLEGSVLDIPYPDESFDCVSPSRHASHRFAAGFRPLSAVYCRCDRPVDDGIR